MCVHTFISLVSGGNCGLRQMVNIWDTSSGHRV